MLFIETAEQLEHAADLIEARGWRQGSRGYPIAKPGRHPALCLVEALAMSGLRTMDALSIHLDLPPGGRKGRRTRDLTPAERLVRWNDDPQRSEGDVLDALRGCAKEIRNVASA